MSLESEQRWADIVWDWMYGDLEPYTLPPEEEVTPRKDSENKDETS